MQDPLQLKENDMQRLLTGLVLSASCGLALAAGTDGIVNAPILSLSNNAPITGSNATATADPGELYGHPMAGGKSVWFRIDLTTSATFNAKTEGSEFDTTLALYRGAHVSEMREVAGNDDKESPNRWSEITVNLSAGTYYLALDGYSGANGNYTLAYQFALNGAPPAAPANDAFANAILLENPVDGDVVRTDVRSATIEEGESLTGNASVWYRFDTSQSGIVKLQTLKSAFDTKLHVFTGTSLSALTQVAASDDVSYPQGNLLSALSFTATAGTTYYIRLSAHGDTRGTALLAYGPASMSGTANLDASYSGTWWNAERGGEGIMLDISDHPDPNTLGTTISMSWYTYDPDGNPIYLIGAAMLDPTITATTPITIPMFTTSGARFGAAFNPAHVVTTPWGSVTLRFLGCNLLNVKYEPAGASWGASSTIVMRRFLARAPGNSCP